MRDPNRIDGVIEELTRVWKMYPDLRCAQFMSNILNEFYSTTKTDPFFVEDGRFVGWLKERFPS